MRFLLDINVALIWVVGRGEPGRLSGFKCTRHVTPDFSKVQRTPFGAHVITTNQALYVELLARSVTVTNLTHSFPRN
jgi:hypothetical protein